MRFTDFILVAVIFLLFPLFFVGGVSVLSNGYSHMGFDHRAALENLEQYSTELGYAAKSCQSTKNADGLVNCTAVDGKGELLNLECAGAFTADDTCNARLAIPSVRRY